MAGTLTLQFAQGTAVAANSADLTGSSHLSVQKIDSSAIS